MMVGVTLDDLASLITTRRTNMRVDRDRAVPAGLVEELCRLATWAPNHKMTEPWRFIAITGDRRADLGEAAAAHQAALGEHDDGRLGKTRVKYLRTPLSLVVACAASSDPTRSAEDRDAVAAGIQNLLLAATAAGLATYWGTGVVCEAPGVKAMCGLKVDDVIVAVIYVGWPLDQANAVPRSTPRITWLS
jgi:nitroreductase